LKLQISFFPSSLTILHMKKGIILDL